MTPQQKTSSKDHPLLWAFGAAGNALAFTENTYGAWWLWMILCGLCTVPLIGWWERRRARRGVQ